MVKRTGYKLLVSDIDGTLLDDKGRISAADKDAVARLVQAGVGVTLSSGRVMQACLGVLKELSLDGYHIFADGAVVVQPETGEIVYARPIEDESLGQAVEFVQRCQMNIDFFSATRYFCERETWITDIRREFFGLEPAIIDLRSLPGKERIIKGTIIVRSPEERAKADAFFEEFRDRLSFSWTKTPAYPDVDFINVISPGVSKGEALQALARHLGLTLAEVAAIGDGVNDIPLLTTAGLAIAMGHAPDELKAVADYVTLDINASGLASAVERLLL